MGDIGSEVSTTGGTRSSLPPYGTYARYQQVYGPHTYIGDRVVDLAQEFKTLVGSPGCPPYLHLYCDELRVPLTAQGAFDLELPPGLRSLEIYARSFLPSATQRSLQSISTVNWTSSTSTVTVVIYVEDQPSGWTIKSIEGKALTVISDLHHSSLPVSYPDAGDGYFFPSTESVGFMFKINAQGYVPSSLKPIQDIFPGSLEIDLDDLAQDDMYSRPSHLAHLVETVFSDAAAFVTESNLRGNCRSKCTFVAKISRTSPTYADLYLQSREMLQRLTLPNDNTLWAPNVSFKSLESELKYRVKVATLLSTEKLTGDIREDIESVREALREALKRILEGQDKLKKEIGEVGSIIVVNMAFSNENFMAKARDAKAELDRAKRERWNLWDDFKEIEKEVEAAEKKFQKGIDAWKEQQKWNAIFGAILSVIELQIAIVGAIATGGAMSAGAAGKAVDTGKKVADAAKAGSDFVKTLEKIQKVFAELKKLVDAASKVKAAVDKLKKAGKISGEDKKDMTDRIMPAICGEVDFIKIKLGWEEYQLGMEELFKDLESSVSGVTGYREWKMANQKLILRAYASVKAQKQLQDAQIQCDRAERDAERVRKHGEKLGQIAKDLQNMADNDKRDDKDRIADPNSARNQQNRLNQRVTRMGIRSCQRWLFLDFHKYSTAVMYDTARNNFPVPLTATRDLKDLVADIQQIVASMNKNHRVLTGLSFPINFKASRGIITNGMWMDTLQATKGLTFTLPPEDKAYYGHKQMKLSSVEVYINGLTPNKSHPDYDSSVNPKILISVIIGPRTTIFDDAEYKEFFIEPQTRTFDRRTDAEGGMLPDHGSVYRGINQKADYRSDGVTIAPSLFSSGSVRVLNADEWNWDNVTDVNFDFYCDANQLGG